ncbi:hypothetical protein GDO78_022803 [Eleutherodactylus coqui]|uniref:Uncharacterized protein n=1 Tax=Eleutherodactylus coqui TaxID=57060 RepID=A0A8J6EM76_ELECQ|nr:hypothetical protein GDO78_022803 [Eleutherodactylus coqui]
MHDLPQQERIDKAEEHPLLIPMEPAETLKNETDKSNDDVVQESATRGTEMLQVLARAGGEMKDLEQTKGY